MRQLNYFSSMEIMKKVNVYMYYQYKSREPQGASLLDWVILLQKWLDIYTPERSPIVWRRQGLFTLECVKIAI